MINKGHRGRPARRAELAAFLRAQRARLRPADVGLPEGSAPGRRRTPGLRREEVAQLSGVGVTWYTWLEQGRDITASAQVINALARALLLNPDQHRHLRDLAGLTAPAPETPVDDVLPRLQRLVDAATPNAACVYDVHFDYLVWNTSYARLRRDPGMFPRDRRNLLWMMFTHSETRARLLQWERVARAVLSHFRTAVGQRPDDPRFAEIVAGLAEASPEFREWWAEYPIGYFRPATIGIDHPQCGPITLEIYQLRLAESPDVLMVMEVPASTGDLQRVASLLDRRSQRLSPFIPVGAAGARDSSGQHHYRHAAGTRARHFAHRQCSTRHADHPVGRSSHRHTDCGLPTITAGTSAACGPTACYAALAKPRPIRFWHRRPASAMDWQERPYGSSSVAEPCSRSAADVSTDSENR